MAIDLSPGHKSLTERYDVIVPMHVLENAIRWRCTKAVADAILAEYRAAKRRYNRASRIERASHVATCPLKP